MNSVVSLSVKLKLIQFRSSLSSIHPQAEDQSPAQLICSFMSSWSTIVQGVIFLLVKQTLLSTTS